MDLEDPTPVRSLTPEAKQKLTEWLAELSESVDG